MGPVAERNGLLAKVCGMTRAVDVQAALEAGADYVGFVSFAPSPRHLTDAQILALGAPLEGKGPKGLLVTVDRPRSGVESLLAQSALSGVQLCGSEAPSDWARAPFQVFRRISAGPGAAEEMLAWSAIAEAFVVDHPAAPGGTGERVPVDDVLAAVAAGPVFLAGGLGPEVLENGLDPRLLEAGLLGVDASSGLERAPGTKSRTSIQRFVSAAHSAPRMTR